MKKSNFKIVLALSLLVMCLQGCSPILSRVFEKEKRADYYPATKRLFKCFAERDIPIEGVLLVASEFGISVATDTLLIPKDAIRAYRKR